MFSLKQFENSFYSKEFNFKYQFRVNGKRRMKIIVRKTGQHPPKFPRLSFLIKTEDREYNLKVIDLLVHLL